jgi:hypothetical protein
VGNNPLSYTDPAGEGVLVQKKFDGSWLGFGTPGFKGKKRLVEDGGYSRAACWEMHTRTAVFIEGLGSAWAFTDACRRVQARRRPLMTSNRAGGVLMVIGGAYVIIRSFRGRAFFLTGVGGERHGKAPNWIARPLMLLVGIGALIIAIGLWRQG